MLNFNFNLNAGLKRFFHLVSMRNFLVLAILLVFTSFFAASAQNYQVHSVYMYSFMKYIKWPDTSENKPFKLGVLGDSEVTPFLEKLAASKRTGNRPIELVRTDSSSVLKMNSLDMLFIPEGSLQTVNIDELISLAEKEHIVLISDEIEFPAGGHINFIEENGKLFFELDRQALEKAGVRVATELMALARPVQ